TICRISEEAFNRPGTLRYTVEDIPVDMCSHLVLGGFFRYTETGELDTSDSDDHLTPKCIVNALKEKYPHLKILLEIGEVYNGASFARLINSADTRERFVNSVMKWVRRYDFDGVSVFWDAYNATDVTPDAKRDLRDRFSLNRSRAGAASNIGYIACYFTGSIHLIRAHTLPAFSRLVDLFQAFTALLRRTIPGQTGMHTQLFPSFRDKGSSRRLNLDSIVRMLKDARVPDQKIVVTLSFAGRLFMLLDKNQHGVLAPTNPDYDNEKVATPPFYKTAFHIVLTQICRGQILDGWPAEWDSVTASPYTYDDECWVSYDDEASLRMKVDWAILQNLAGVFVWSVDQDDYRADCHGHTYALMRVIYKMTCLGCLPLPPERECKE
ncbi:chitinase, putative, partial [Ixodes scapularis]